MPFQTFPDYDNIAEFQRAESRLAKYGFTNNSWKNDTCPSLHALTDEVREIGCIVFVDYADPEQRETGPETPLFGVVWTETDDSESFDTLEEVESYLLDSGVTENPAPTPDVESRTVKRLAGEFRRRIRAEFDSETLAEIDARNESPAYSGPICATHDFCDANVIMARAFKEVCGCDVAPERLEHARVWSSAWGNAKVNGFGG